MKPWLEAKLGNGLNFAESDFVKGQLIPKASFRVLIWTKKGIKLFFDFCTNDLK